MNVTYTREEFNKRLADFFSDIKECESLDEAETFFMKILDIYLHVSDNPIWEGDIKGRFGYAIDEYNKKCKELILR